MKNNKLDLFKAAKGEEIAGHKYIMRTGSPGSYLYWYRDEYGNTYASSKEISTKATISSKNKQLTLVRESKKNIEAVYNKIIKMDPSFEAQMSKNSFLFSASIESDIPNSIFDSTVFTTKNHEMTKRSEEALKTVDIFFKDKGLFPYKIDSQRKLTLVVAAEDYAKSNCNGMHYSSGSDPLNSVVGLFQADKIHKTRRTLFHEIGHYIDLVIGDKVTKGNVGDKGLQYFTDTKVGQKMIKDIKDELGGIQYATTVNDKELFARCFEIYVYTKFKKYKGKEKFSEELFRPNLFHYSKGTERGENPAFVPSINRKTKEQMTKIVMSTLDPIFKKYLK